MQAYIQRVQLLWLNLPHHPNSFIWEEQDQILRIIKGLA